MAADAMGDRQCGILDGGALLVSKNMVHHAVPFCTGVTNHDGRNE